MNGRTKDALLGAVVAFVGVAVLTVLFQHSSDYGFYVLFTIPVALASRLLGLAAGVAASCLGVAAIVLHSELAGVDIASSGYVTRAVALMAVAVVVAPRRTAEAPASDAAPESNGVARRLTPRELEVLRLLALGHTNGEIAEQLYLSVRTVESHRARLQRKLMRRGRSELTRYALQHGIVQATEVESTDTHDRRWTVVTEPGY